MTNQQMMNICIAKKDRLIAEIRDKVPEMKLERLLQGKLMSSDAGLVSCLTAIVCLELHSSNLELKELCTSGKQKT